MYMQERAFSSQESKMQQEYEDRLEQHAHKIQVITHSLSKCHIREMLGRTGSMYTNKSVTKLKLMMHSQASATPGALARTMRRERFFSLEHMQDHGMQMGDYCIWG
jgi:hypothetical protein